MALPKVGTRGFAPLRSVKSGPEKEIIWLRLGCGWHGSEAVESLPHRNRQRAEGQASAGTLASGGERRRTVNKMLETYKNIHYYINNYSF
ncbi:hypothetical protein [Hymenobacter terricola]|uniref:hypothetical protein n=1 Tax=Hymenobacter terricola TaxID=2819236 RepID=UPI001B3162A3|nr:hypothetical protein [Hymenobacter terricola]